MVYFPRQQGSAVDEGGIMSFPIFKGINFFVRCDYLVASSPLHLS